MKRTLAFALLALAACTPTPTPEPAATVERIYKPIAESKGEKGTDIASVPMTEELALKLQEVESKADGPVIDWDIAGNCQDCTGFSDLKVGPAKGLPETPGHTMIEARFKFPADGEKALLWDMVKVGDAWKVDNIEAEGFNLRTTLDEQLAAQAAGGGAPAGEPDAAEQAGNDAVQCMTFIRLEANAIEKATPPGDTKVLDHAFAAWKARAEAHFTADELAQFFASNVAVMDDTAPADIKTKADACVLQVPAPASVP